jgi:hypothetical protein
LLPVNKGQAAFRTAWAVGRVRGDVFHHCEQVHTRVSTGAQVRRDPGIPSANASWAAVAVQAWVLIVRRDRQDDVRQDDGHAVTLQAHDVHHRPTPLPDAEDDTRPEAQQVLFVALAIG